MALRNPRFLMLNNMISIFEQTAVLGLVAAGIAILIISENSDMSAGAVIRLSPCLMAIMTSAGISIPAATAAGIFTTVFCTFFNGVLAILFKAPSFIVSLTTTSVYAGAALYLTEGVIQTIYGKFDTMNRFRLFGAVLLIFIISLMGCMAVGAILRHTQIGRRIFTIGSNEKAAFLSNIKMTRNKLMFFAMNSFFVGLAAVLLLSRVGPTLLSIGTEYELQAIGAMVTSGAPINGGKGNIVGTLFDILPMRLISNVLNILGVNSYLQKITSGALIVISLGISAIRVHMLTKD